MKLNYAKYVQSVDVGIHNAALVSIAVHLTCLVLMLKIIFPVNEGLSRSC